MHENVDMNFYAISNLHYLRDNIHSDNISNTKNLNFKDIVKIFLLLKNLICEKKNFYTTDIRKCDILIISNFLDNNLKFKDVEDIYFGEFPKLIDKKFKTSIFYRNLTSHSSKYIFSVKEKKINLISKITSIRNEIKNILSFIIVYIKIFFFSKNNFLKEYLNIKSILSIVGNLRISDQVAEICKVKSPKVVIIPYEGHAWERVLIYKIKNYFPRIKIIGYQFSIIYEDSHSLLQKLKANFNPDVIITTGEITKKKFEEQNFRNVLKVGSAKYSAFKDLEQKDKNFNNNFLILPSGTLKEHENLIKFTGLLANLYTSKNFFFKSHPNFVNLSILKELKRPNVFIDEFADDNQYFFKCGYVFFIQSSMIFSAVTNKLIPINVQIEDKIDTKIVNPISSVLPDENIIKDINDLNKILRNSYLPRNAIEYCKNYFENFHLEELNKYFNENIS